MSKNKNKASAPAPAASDAPATDSPKGDAPAEEQANGAQPETSGAGDADPTLGDGSAPAPDGPENASESAPENPPENDPPADPPPPVDQAEVPEGFTRLRAPENAGGCGWNGESFDVVDGFVTVPSEAVADLTSHGYTE